jgi:hypothetical protein
VSAGINGLLPGGDYLAIGVTARCASFRCRTPVPYEGEFCEACTGIAADMAEADRDRDAAEDHRTDDSGWREARRA